MIHIAWVLLGCAMLGVGAYQVGGAWALMAAGGLMIILGKMIDLIALVNK